MSNAIKISGKFEVEEPLQIDQSYNVNLSVDIASIGKHSNQDGTYDFVFNAKPLMGEIVQSNGTSLKLIKKGSQSQRWRWEVNSRGEDYDKIMTIILTYPEEVLDFLKKIE